MSHPQTNVPSFIHFNLLFSFVFHFSWKWALWFSLCQAAGTQGCAPECKLVQNCALWNWPLYKPAKDTSLIRHLRSKHTVLPEICVLLTKWSHLVQTYCKYLHLWKNPFMPSFTVCTVTVQIKWRGQVETIFGWCCWVYSWHQKILKFFWVIVDLYKILWDKSISSSINTSSSSSFFGILTQLQRDFVWLTQSLNDNKGNLKLSSYNCYFQTLHFDIGFVLTFSCEPANIVLPKKKFLSSQRWTSGLLRQKK